MRQIEIGKTYVIKPLNRALRVLPLAQSGDSVSVITLDSGRDLVVRRSALRRDFGTLAADSDNTPRSRN